MAEKKPLAILRTKGEILLAKDINNLVIEDEVIKDQNFIDAKQNDLFAFFLLEGSDYKVVNCKRINSEEDFFNYTFGMTKEDEPIPIIR